MNNDPNNKSEDKELEEFLERLEEDSEDPRNYKYRGIFPGWKALSNSRPGDLFWDPRRKIFILIRSKAPTGKRNGEIRYDFDSYSVRGERGTGWYRNPETYLKNSRSDFSKRLGEIPPPPLPSTRDVCLSPVGKIKSEKRTSSPPPSSSSKKYKNIRYLGASCVNIRCG